MLRFHHAGYAVPNITDYLEEFFIPLFEPVHVSGIVDDPLQKVRVAFATLPGGERIELIEPMGDQSPVSGFLNDRRGGLYHLCYSTDAIETSIARFRERGCIVVSGPTPAAAFDGRRIAFLFTPHRDLVELVEEDMRE